jgi:hypothetical protein
MAMTEERMAADDELVLDGNAAAGVLATAFGLEVTARQGTCAHCGTVSLIGTLRAYVRGPGIVLRCPACSGVVIRIAETPAGLRVDRSGAADLAIDPGT